MLTICLGISLRLLIGSAKADISNGGVLYFATIVIDALLLFFILEIVSKAVDCGL